MSNVDELVEEVARVIDPVAWWPQLHRDNARERRQVASDKAKAAIKAVRIKLHEQLLAKHPWTDTDAAISDFLLKQLED